MKIAIDLTLKLFFFSFKCLLKPNSHLPVVSDGTLSQTITDESSGNSWCLFGRCLVAGTCFYGTCPCLFIGCSWGYYESSAYYHLRQLRALTSRENLLPDTPTDARDLLQVQLRQKRYVFFRMSGLGFKTSLNTRRVCSLYGSDVVVLLMMIVLPTVLIALLVIGV